MTCWTLWNCQNKARLNELGLPLDRIVDHAFNILQVFQRAHPALPKPVRPTRPSWKPPDPYKLKTNSDGAIFDDLSAAGMGVVVRNSQEEIVAALSGKIPIPSSVHMVETLAARRAVRFIHELGIHSSSFENDLEVSINALRHNNLLHSAGGHIVQYMLSYANSLQSLSLSNFSARVSLALGYKLSL